MTNTNDVQLQHIEVYDSNNDFLGYVSKVTTTKGTTVCSIVDWKCQFAKRRAISVLRSAQSAIVYITSDKKKYYRMKENFTFKMVEV